MSSDVLGRRIPAAVLLSVLLTTAGLATLLVAALFAATKASESATRSLRIEAQNHTLLDRLNRDEQLLRQLVSDATDSAAQAQANAAQAVQIIGDIDRTLNAICRADRCAAPVIIFPPTQPARPPGTSPPTTRSPPMRTSTTTTTNRHLRERADRKWWQSIRRGQ